MNEKIIDPSEIIIEKSGTIKENLIRANPWTRFLARFFDYVFFILILWGARALLHVRPISSQYESFVPFEFFIWIPIEAILLSTLGTTLGKFLLKIKLRQGRRFRLDFRTAIKRSFNVWLRGLGMMIPIINGICLLVAYNRLKVFQMTTWDREDHIAVSHAPIGRWRVIVSALITVAVFVMYFNGKRQI